VVGGGLLFFLFTRFVLNSSDFLFCIIILQMVFLLFYDCMCFVRRRCFLPPKIPIEVVFVYFPFSLPRIVFVH